MVCSVCGMYLFLNSLGCVFFHDTSLVGGLKICSLDLSGLARLGDRESFGCRTSRMNSGSKRNKSQFGDRGRSQHIIFIAFWVSKFSGTNHLTSYSHPYFYFHCFARRSVSNGFGGRSQSIICFPTMHISSLAGSFVR